MKDADARTRQPEKEYEFPPIYLAESIAFLDNIL